MLLLYIFNLFFALALALPTPPGNDGAQEVIHFIIPEDGHGFWRRHGLAMEKPDKFMEAGGKLYDVIHVFVDNEGKEKIHLYRDGEIHAPVIFQEDLNTIHKLYRIVGPWSMLSPVRIPPGSPHLNPVNFDLTGAFSVDGQLKTLTMRISERDSPRRPYMKASIVPH